MFHLFLMIVKTIDWLRNIFRLRMLLLIRWFPFHISTFFIDSFILSPFLYLLHLSLNEYDYSVEFLLCFGLFLSLILSQDWALELEEVFSLEREGEFDKYAPYRAKLKNKMLLWHGELSWPLTFTIWNLLSLGCYGSQNHWDFLIYWNIIHWITVLWKAVWYKIILTTGHKFSVSYRFSVDKLCRYPKPRITNCSSWSPSNRIHGFYSFISYFSEVLPRKCNAIICSFIGSYQ